MFCSKCGTQIDDQANFCPNCGARITHAPVVESTGTSSSKDDFSSWSEDVFDKSSFKGFDGDKPVEVTAPVGGKAPGADPWDIGHGPAPQADAWSRGSNAYVQPASGKKKSRLPVIIIIAIIVIGAVIALVGSRIFIGAVTEKHQYDYFDELIEDYFNYAQKGDKKAIANLFYPELMKEYDNNIDQLDDWTDFYGSELDNYEYTYSESRADYKESFESYYHVETSDYLDVSVCAYYEDFYVNMDFECVNVDGDWYLIEIW